MTLYYTTSAGEDEEQLNPQASLGGYKSSTPVTNDDFDNLFSEISILTTSQNRDQYIALVMVNETGSDITGAKIWIEYGDSPQATLEIAAVDFTLVSEVYKMERTRSIYNKPFTGDFEEYLEGSEGVIGDVSAGEYVGLWFKRSLNMENIELDENGFYESDTDRKSMYKEVELETTEKIQVKISWD